MKHLIMLFCMLAFAGSMTVVNGDEVNSRVVVRDVDQCMTVYSFTYKGQEYLVVKFSESVTIIAVPSAAETAKILTKVTAEKESWTK